MVLTSFVLVTTVKCYRHTLASGDFCVRAVSTGHGGHKAKRYGYYQSSHSHYQIRPSVPFLKFVV